MCLITLTLFIVFTACIKDSLSALTADNVTVYVMEDFDAIDKEWLTTTYNDVGYINAQVVGDEKEKLFGDGCLRIEYEVEQSETWGGYVDLVDPIQERAHNCHGASHISFWYKVLEKQSVPERVHLRLILLDDSNCEQNCTDPSWLNLEYYYSFNNILDVVSEDWTEITVELRGDDDFSSPFVLPGWTGIVGNDVLDKERIRGWRLELSINGDGDLGTSSSGVFLLDHLTCVGGGELLAAAFHPFEVNFLKGTLLTQSLEEGLWYHDNSIQVINASKSELTSAGRFIIDYTIEKEEDWGGLTYYQHNAPGSSYYNLSMSTHISIDYNVLLAAFPAGFSHFRLILLTQDCTSNCDTHSGSSLDHYYAFEDILADRAKGTISLPLKWDSKVSSPLFTQEGKGDIDVSKIKGYRFEFRTDSQAKLGSEIKGIMVLSDLQATSPFADSKIDQSRLEEPQCIEEPGLHYITDDNVSDFRYIQFAGSKCCEICEEDPTCNFFVVSDGDCFTTAYLHPKSVSLRGSHYLIESTFWMDDVKKRGDFCSICECSKQQLSIDCRGKDLVSIPKTFVESWRPISLDLRDNPRMALLGEFSLDAINNSLKNLYLPKNLKYLSEALIVGLPKLENVLFEQQNHQIENVISMPNSDLYGDVCCTHGTSVSTVIPTKGLTFCTLQLFKPGVDSILLPFIENIEADHFVELIPSSPFMSEAASSPENCAEYCSITDECNYFSYDGRVKQAEHRCYLQTNNGTQDTVCCKADDYADAEKTIPGWYSGKPPRTRHFIDNARVFISAKRIHANETNDFTASYEVYLGSSPLRGAVWVTPSVADDIGIDLIVTPTRVALYDVNSRPTVTLKVRDPTALLQTDTIFIHNKVESCDTAFTIREFSTLSSTTNVYLQVTPTPPGSNLSGIIVPITITCLVLFTYLYVSRQRRLADRVWEIKLKHLKFDEPPEVIGRGTFGLVLLAEYRGTQVAVKRVIPPKVGKKSASAQFTSLFGRGVSSDAYENQGIEKESSERTEKVVTFSSNKLERIDQSNITRSRISLPLKPQSRSWSKEDLDMSIYSQRFSTADSTRNSVLSVDKFSSNVSGPLQFLFNKGDYSLLKSAFIREMRYLSKLRHPCITTVMGAVIDRKEEPMLVMEYMVHGSLHDLLHNQTYTFDNEYILPILRDITNGIRFLHCAVPQVIHGDLKAGNILIDGKFRAKVADFGLTQKKQIGAAFSFERLRATGTAYWMAPELLAGKSTNTVYSDVYSFGIILYEVYSRREPYEGEDFIQVIHEIIHQNKRPPVPPSCPVEIKRLMTACLSRDPAKRPTFEYMDKNLKKIEISNFDASDITRRSKADKRQKEITESLLNEVFPEHIARALREGRKIEPEVRDMVTIFFSDIVGFTSISSTLEPIKISDMLDRLYAELDSLSREYDVFKVETVGDAYMAVTNLVKEQPDHAKRIAEFSIGALKAANSTLIDKEDPSLGYVNIRVGFHSGPVVANVIGSRNPRYCLFGDTVNTASRMESNSEKNQIHCSERAANLLMTQCPDIRLYLRGKIQVKGKGEMVTYWVDRKPETFLAKKINDAMHVSTSIPVLGKNDGKWNDESAKTPKKIFPSLIRRNSFNGAQGKLAFGGHARNEDNEKDPEHIP